MGQVEEVRGPVLGKESRRSESSPADFDLQVSPETGAPHPGTSPRSLESEALQGEILATVPPMGGPSQPEPDGGPLREGVSSVEAGPEKVRTEWSDWRTPKPPKKGRTNKEVREAAAAARVNRLRYARRIACRNCTRHVFETPGGNWKHKQSGSKWCVPKGSRLPKWPHNYRAEAEPDGL